MSATPDAAAMKAGGDGTKGLDSIAKKEMEGSLYKNDAPIDGLAKEDLESLAFNEMHAMKDPEGKQGEDGDDAIPKLDFGDDAHQEWAKAFKRNGKFPWGRHHFGKGEGMGEEGTSGGQRPAWGRV